MPQTFDLSSLPEPRAEWFRRPSGYDASGGIHGLAHTRRVLVHASELADVVALREWERHALTLAALWHDIGRTNDGADYYHGAKSAGKVVALGLHEGIEPKVYEVALHAIAHHCGDEEFGERAAWHLLYYQRDGAGDWCMRQIDPEAALRVFRVLKDADGLDRVRLGDLDPSFFRYDVARERVDRAWELLGELP